jgi:hypothetical protein
MRCPYCARRKNCANRYGSAARWASVQRAGVVNGLGCDPSRVTGVSTTEFVPDDSAHEVAMCYVVRGKGLVVLISCSHRGVVNTVKQAQSATGVNKVHGVIGGFHLPSPGRWKLFAWFGRGRGIKDVELYAKVRYVVQIEGLSKPGAARNTMSSLVPSRCRSMHLNDASLD